MIDKRLYRLLVLAVWMVGFSGVRADGTQPKTELARAESMSDSSLCPVAPSGGIAVVEFCPEENLFLDGGVCQELLIGHRKCIGVMANTIIIRENSESASTTRPFLRLFRKDSNRNHHWFNVHHSDVEGRSFSYIVDEEAHSELLPCFRFSVFPCGCEILSSLDNVLAVTQPSSLFQTYRIYSGICLFSHSDNLPTGRLSTFNGGYSGLFSSSRSSLSGESLFLYLVIIYFSSNKCRKVGNR